MLWLGFLFAGVNIISAKKMMAENRVSELKYKTPFFPYVTLFGIWVQVFCLIVIAFTDDLRSTLYAGIPMMVIPMVIF